MGPGPTCSLSRFPASQCHMRVFRVPATARPFLSRKKRLIGRAFLLDSTQLAQRGDAIRLIEQLGDGHAGEGTLRGRSRLIQFAVQRAKTGVVLQSQRTVTDTRNRLDGRNHVQNRNIVRRANQGKTAARSRLGTHQAGTHQRLQNLVGIASRYAHRLDNLLRGMRLFGSASQHYQGPESILSGLRDHASPPCSILYLDVQISRG
jgi:hypothetical protein